MSKLIHEHSNKIVRIVKMSFIPEKVNDFLEVFHSSANLIRDFDGCVDMHLYRDVSAENIYFTYSIWETEAHLNKYRNSQLFRNIWAKTKINFEQKAEASSLVLID